MEFKSISIYCLILVLVAQFVVVSSRRLVPANYYLHTKKKSPIIHMKPIYRGDRQPHIQAATDDFPVDKPHDKIRGNCRLTLNRRRIEINNSIGTPPVPQRMRSCYMCTSETTSIVYDPAESSSAWRILSCGSNSCLNLMCDVEIYHCRTYRSSSAHRSYLDGVARTDILGIKVPTATTTSGVGAVVGCGTEIGRIRILGLYNAGPASLVSPRGPQFSYCMGPNIMDRKYSPLIIGEGANMLGKPTPLDLYNNRYYLTLEGISVGQKLLDIDSTIFERTPFGDGGVVIDTGATYTFLIQPAYDALVAQVVDFVKQGFSEVTLKEYTDKLCYYGSVKKDMSMFPLVTLHFAEGVNLSSNRFGIFDQVDNNSFCLAFLEPPTKYLPSLVGLMVQSGYNFGFDRNAKKLYIENISCQTLQD